MPRERTMIRRNKSVSIGGICGRIKLIISGSMYLKICEMLGGVGEKIYLCITLSCTRQIESKALFALVGKVFA